MKNKLDSLNLELSNNKTSIGELNNQLSESQSLNQSLQETITNLQQQLKEATAANMNSNKPDESQPEPGDTNNEQKETNAIPATESQSQTQQGPDHESAEQKEGDNANGPLPSQQEHASLTLEKTESYVQVFCQETQTPMTPLITQKDLDDMKKQYTEQISNWKLMYEELEKTAMENVTKTESDKLGLNREIEELKEETQRLEHNLKLREEQLEKSNIKLSQVSNAMEKQETTIQALREQNEILTETNQQQQQQYARSGGDEAKWKKIIAQKDKEIEEVMKEGEEWASNCHNLETKLKKLLESLTDRNDEIDELNEKINEKEERITSLLENMESSKTDTQSIEERNKLLTKHNEDTKLQNVQLMEEIDRLKSKIKAVESERDEYVEMIEDNKAIVQKLNIQVFRNYDLFLPFFFGFVFVYFWCFSDIEMLFFLCWCR